MYFAPCILHPALHCLLLLLYFCNGWPAKMCLVPFRQPSALFCCCHLVLHTYILLYCGKQTFSLSLSLSKPKASVSGASNQLEWVTDWVYAAFFRGLAQQWRPWTKQNLTQKWYRGWGWCLNFKYKHSAEKGRDTTLDDVTSVIVTALCNQSEAFALDLGEDQSHYLYRNGCVQFGIYTKFQAVHRYCIQLTCLV